uniref:E3 ubiquitin-protein ligase RNF180 n=1 Tax=Ornithorhynchus anatinus TaxID=9258 RepID=F7ESF9_ORNAN
MNCLMEKAQWMVGGELKCPSCGACFGSYDLGGAREGSWGQLVAARQCEDWPDHPPSPAVRPLGRPASTASPYEAGAGLRWDRMLTGPGVAPRLRAMADSDDVPGRLMEALCLEAPSPCRWQWTRKWQRWKGSRPKCGLPASLGAAERCPGRAFHRKSWSWDLDGGTRWLLLPAPSETCGAFCLQPDHLRQWGAQPSEPPCGLQLSPGGNGHCSLWGSSKVDSSVPLERLSGALCGPQTPRAGELEWSFDAAGRHPDDGPVGELPFLIDVPSAGGAGGSRQEEVIPTGVPRSDGCPLGTMSQRLSKRDKNKWKSLSRKRQRRERWLEKQTSNEDTSLDEDHECAEEKESYMCAVCLDVYFNPYMCSPCQHIFCEPCLRTLAKDNAASTPCPLCRTIISRVFFQTDLNNATKAVFPEEYSKIKQSFQKSNLAKWPLPSCRKTFHLFGGFPGRADPVTRRQFPHGAHRMDYLHFEEDGRGWRLDMDMDPAHPRAFRSSQLEPRGWRSEPWLNESLFANGTGVFVEQ